MSNIANAILSADETFLVTLSNKGIYNRALKEYETSVSNLEINDSDNTVKAEFSDGISIIVTNTVQNYKCTCPSRTVCKHLVMAVIAAKNNIQSTSADSGSPDNPNDSGSEDGKNNSASETVIPQSLPNFDFAAKITPQQLEKLTTKKIYSEALFNIKTGSKIESEKAVIEISSVLSVMFTHNQISQTVRFLPAHTEIKTSAELTNWANTAVCSCKSSNFCVHKTEAVMRFILHKKGEDIFNREFFPEISSDEIVEFGAYVIPYIKQFVIDIFSSGLARNSDAVSQRFLQLATICHSQGLANMERACDRIAGQYELFEKKSAAFSVNYLMSDLCNLISHCEILEKASKTDLEKSADGDTETDKNINIRNIVGVFREQYNQIPPAEFYGLGAYQWHSTSGYTGVTALFYSPDLSDFAAYTTAMPDENNPNAIQMYNNPAPWGISTKLSEITDICMVLKGARINSRNNISSSNETTAQIVGKVNIFDEKLDKIRYNNFAVLVENLWEKHNGEENQNQNQSKSLTALILPKKYDKASFNSITQVYSFYVYDTDNRKINVSVKYESSSTLLIENLKKLESKNLLYGPLAVRIYIENGKLNAFPIALYIKSDEDNINSDEFEMINLSLDDIDKKLNKNKDNKSEKKSKYFNW